MEFLHPLEAKLNDIFGKQAPALPQNIKEIVVKIAPYLTILGLILTIPAIFALIGLGGAATMLAPFGGVGSVAAVPGMWLGILLLIPVVILEAMAVPGLFARKAIAWKYMFWAQIISVIASLVQFNLLGAILTAVIGFYLLFQVKSFYK